MTLIAPTLETRSRIAAEFATLDERSEMLCLVKLADWLTLMARGTYDQAGGVADSVRLRAFNEAQNRIQAQLVRLLTTDERRYPDDVFASILVDQLQALDLDVAEITHLVAECTTKANQSRRTRQQTRLPRTAAASHR